MKYEWLCLLGFAALLAASPTDTHAQQCGLTATEANLPTGAASACYDAHSGSMAEQRQYIQRLGMQFAWSANVIGTESACYIRIVPGANQSGKLWAGSGTVQCELNVTKYRACRARADEFSRLSPQVARECYRQAMVEGPFDEELIRLGGKRVSTTHEAAPDSSKGSKLLLFYVVIPVLLVALVLFALYRTNGRSRTAGHMSMDVVHHRPDAVAAVPTPYFEPSRELARERNERAASDLAAAISKHSDVSDRRDAIGTLLRRAEVVEVFKSEGKRVFSKRSGRPEVWHHPSGLFMPVPEYGTEQVFTTLEAALAHYERVVAKR